MKNVNFRTDVKKRYLGSVSTVILGMTLLTPLCSAVAQEAENAEEPVFEEILVTGSRIRTNPLDKGAPILNVTAEDIDKSGLTSLGDFLQRLPGSGSALNTKFNSSGNFGFPPDGGGIGAGAAQVDLRNLGSKRVLVLVDGVRWVHGSSASGVSGATDLNTIPTSIIERVEVLQDGASAVYGSDAIAGVVNIITKKNQDGFEASAYVGAYDRGDGETQEYEVSWGQQSDKMNIFVSLSYNKQNRVSAADIPLSRFPSAGATSCEAGGCSSGTPQGRFFLTDPNTLNQLDLTLNDGVINDGGANIPFYNPAAPGTGDFHEFATADRFNFAPFNLVLTPSERVGVYSQVSYEIADNITMNFKALFNNRQSTNQAAPEPLFIGPEAGNGNLLDTISIHENNPFNPFGFTIDAETNGYFMGRRPLEAGPRIFNQTVNTWYVSGGFEGAFEAGDRNFYWDITSAYSKNRADQVKNGAFNSRHLKIALGDPDVCAATPGCVPFNFFGGQGSGSGSITPEMLEWVSFVQKDLSEQTLFDVTANLAGEIVELPAGPVGFAIGAEYREQSGFFVPDSIVTAGESAGVPSGPADGSYDTKEFYAEINLPLIRDAAFADLLDLNAAVRYSDYSTFGSNSTFKVGGKWRPTPDILLRASWSQGFRAPNIGELFGTFSRFDQTLADPCSDFNNNGASATTIANCVAAGVPADGSYAQFNPQISVITGGNINLQPEESESWSVGGVWSPDLGESSLTLEVNYYDIKLDDAISAVDAQLKLNNCFTAGDSVACQGITRTSGGVINGFDTTLQNIGGIRTSGFDFSANYMSPETDIGMFGFVWTNTLLFKYERLTEGASGLISSRLEGTERGDPEQAFPKWKSTGTLTWYKGDWTASWTGRYTAGVTEVNADDNQMAAVLYNDLQVTWAPEERNYSVSLGVNNIFDKDPSLCTSCALNGFDGSLHDLPGQFGYLRLTFKK
ncbi:TonB-dependent receptor [Paremcibacter congregatus]|uniref:TonB-dependent receptor n=2 Tax=Paremcibacter congregatus TaxID=2043170 RepID=A0A2G4YLQ1_9PROT|nr:TonB-dependent receptor [Paremcibacter congregatus]QDE28301.1 TonB-dependent receptor [Paremcibacter congregatus]